MPHPCVVSMLALWPGAEQLAFCSLTVKQFQSLIDVSTPKQRPPMLCSR